jgi:hypothetical protein
VGVGVGEGVGEAFFAKGTVSEAEAIFGWIRLVEINHREITANTTTPKAVFLNLCICSPFNCVCLKLSSKLP